MIGGSESFRAVIASHNATAVGGQQNALRIARIDHNVVHHDFRIGDLLPALATIGCLPQAFRSSSIHNLRIAGILLQHSRTACRKWNSLELMEQIARAFALIDTRAGAGVDHGRIGGVDDDGKYIRVVDHALVDVLPIGACIGGLPRQMPGAGIDDIGILGIDSDRFNILDLGMVGRGEPLPTIATIFAAEYSVQRTSHQHFRI